MIKNDQELVTALVESENFSVNACRLAFKFLYGRSDNQCEGALLDLCVDNFKAKRRCSRRWRPSRATPAFASEVHP